MIPVESNPPEAASSAAGPVSVEAAEAGAGEGTQAMGAVKLPTFEGPLDLLLHLCRANEVDVSDIPIALISAQYLEYLDFMRRLDIDAAADYLLMAATLAHIKSRALLPPEEGEEEEEGEDPRAELARRLAAFAAFREAADQLSERPLLGRDVFQVDPDLSQIPEREPVLRVELEALVLAMRRVLESLPQESAVHKVVRERFTLQDQMLAVMDRLQAKPDEMLEFEAVLRDGEPSRARVVITFLAVLELTRIQVIRIYQNVDETGVPHGGLRIRLRVEESDGGT